VALRLYSTDLINEKINFDMSTEVDKKTETSNDIYTVLQVVFGVKMTRLQGMYFSKYVQTLDFGMNTKTREERTKITLNWLKNIYEKSNN
jgi:hypothetical protein